MSDKMCCYDNVVFLIYVLCEIPNFFLATWLLPACLPATKYDFIVRNSNDEDEPRSKYARFASCYVYVCEILDTSPMF